MDRAGEELGGCCISMTLRDYGRFGLFFMRGGKIGETSILPDDWIGQAQPGSRRPAMVFNERVHADGIYEAIGIFGQGIFINPSEDLIIVTSSAWPQADEPKFYRDQQRVFRGGYQDAALNYSR